MGKCAQEWYTISEAAAKLRCSRQAIHQRVKGEWSRSCRPQQRAGTLLHLWLIPADLIKLFTPNPLRQAAGRRNILQKSS